MNKKISPAEVDDLNTERLVQEHSRQRPELPGLSAVPAPRTVSQVLHQVEADNAYLDKVPLEAWLPLAGYDDKLIELAHTNGLIIHVDTQDWTVLLHVRHSTHPQPKALRCVPPVPIEYLSLFEAWHRIKQWRKSGFSSEYQPSADRFGNRPASQRLVFNIGFRYIRLYWTPKGYVWADNFNTAIPHNVLQNTIYFPTLKERASGNKRQATYEQMKHSFSARFQGENVEAIQDLESITEAPTTHQVQAALTEHQAMEELKRMDGETSDEEILARHGAPESENEFTLAAKAKLYHGQDLHSEADICSKADAADTLGLSSSNTPIRTRQKNYLVCTNNKTEGFGIVRAIYSNRVTADRNLTLLSDLVYTRVEYHRVYGKPAVEAGG